MSESAKTALGVALLLYGAVATVIVCAATLYVLLTLYEGAHMLLEIVAQTLESEGAP